MKVTLGDELAKRGQPYVSFVHGHPVWYEEFVCREINCEQTPRTGLLGLKVVCAVTDETPLDFVSYPNKCYATRKGGCGVDWTSDC
jgi:hypothetical protein